MKQIDPATRVTRQLVDQLRTESVTVGVGDVAYILTPAPPSRDPLRQSELCTVAIEVDGRRQILGSLFDYIDRQLGALPDSGRGFPTAFDSLGEAVRFAAGH